MTEIRNRHIGYARVSNPGDTIEAQLEQLRADGCTIIYSEQESGRRSDRPELKRMLKNLQPGDVVTVTCIDRFARSVFDLFASLKRIIEASAEFRPIAQPWADTKTSMGRMVVAVLGAFADFEWDSILTRTTAGRMRAKARGQHMGRFPALTPAQQMEALEQLKAGAFGCDVARYFHVGTATISRLRKAARGAANMNVSFPSARYNRRVAKT